MIDNKFATKRITQTLIQAQPYSDLFVLCGPLNQHIVNSTIHVMENKLKTLNYSKTMISKVKLLGIEMIENMHKHQLKKATVTPYFQFMANKEGLTIIACNAVSAQGRKLLGARLMKYEANTLNELKELYLHRLGNGKITKKGNAGLGLLTIYNRSGKNAGYVLDKISEKEYYFSLEVKILSEN